MEAGGAYRWPPRLGKRILTRNPGLTSEPSRPSRRLHPLNAWGPREVGGSQLRAQRMNCAARAFCACLLAITVAHRTFMRWVHGGARLASGDTNLECGSVEFALPP